MEIALSAFCCYNESVFKSRLAVLAAVIAVIIAAASIIWRIGRSSMEHRKQPPRNSGPETYDSESGLVECPACAGEGQIFPGVEVNLWASGQLRWPDALQAETCEVCQGTGEVDPDTAARWEQQQRAAPGEGDLEETG